MEPEKTREYSTDLVRRGRVKIKTRKYFRRISQTNSAWHRILHLSDIDFEFDECRWRIDLDNGESLVIKFNKIDNAVLISQFDRLAKPPEKPSES